MLSRRSRIVLLAAFAGAFLLRVRSALRAAASNIIQFVQGRIFCRNLACVQTHSVSTHRLEPYLVDVQDTLARAASNSISEQVEALRKVIVILRAGQAEAVTMLHSLLKPGPPTTRAHYLRALHELVGPRPKYGWEQEWVALNIEEQHLLGNADADESWVHENKSVQAQKKKLEGAIGKRVAAGWDEEDAEACQLLLPRRMPIAQALRDRSPRFAASTYAIIDALGKRSANTCSLLPPLLYKNLEGKRGLAAAAREWRDLERCDPTGFQGFCCCSPVNAYCDARNFLEAGYAVAEGSGENLTFVPQDSAVVCFESRPSTMESLHSAVMLSAVEGTFPPNTLFRLHSVQPSFVAPNGVTVKQRLLTVRATYRLPVTQGAGGSSTRLCGSTTTLRFANKDAFIKGMDDVLGLPVVTMAQECTRDQSWTDWKGTRYTLRSEWEYVNGVASTKHDCTPGTRDSLNEGKSVDDFLHLVNAFIQERRGMGHGLQLPLEHAFLSRDMVLAIRLYSGPVFKPINDFLRQLSELHGQARIAMAQDPQVTFAATAGHLCVAVRRLAAVASPEEVSRTLWRGLRGELPSAFWQPDELGDICVVDVGEIHSCPVNKSHCAMLFHFMLPSQLSCRPAVVGKLQFRTWTQPVQTFCGNFIHKKKATADFTTGQTSAYSHSSRARRKFSSRLELFSTYVHDDPQVGTTIICCMAFGQAEKDQNQTRLHTQR